MTGPGPLTQELQMLLETLAWVACRRFGAQSLHVDRRGSAVVGGDRLDIRLDFGDGLLTDLWELDPLLWDEAYWGASRAVSPGQSRIYLPFLHRN